MGILSHLGRKVIFKHYSGNYEKHLRFKYFKPCSWAGVPVKSSYEILGGRAFLEEVCHRGQILRVYSLVLFPLHSVVEDVISQVPASTTCYHYSPTIIHSLSLESQVKINSFISRFCIFQKFSFLPFLLEA